MSDIDKSIITCQSIFEHITGLPFNSWIEQQEQILSALKHQKTFEDLVRASFDLAFDASSFTNTFGFDSNTGAQLIRSINESFKNLAESFGISNSIIQQLVGTDNFSLFLTKISDISLYNDFVSVPENLIPNDFTYSEVNATSEIPPKETPSAFPCKKLSYSDAIKIIELLLPILLWILTYFLSQKPALWQQQHHEDLIQAIEEQNDLQEQSNITHLEQNQLVKEQTQAIEGQTQAIKIQTEYLVSIYNILLESGSDAPTPVSDVPAPASVPPVNKFVVPQTRSDSDSIQYPTEYSASVKNPSHKSHPTSDCESGNSESQSELE